MKTVFVISPLKAPTAEGVALNIAFAEKLCRLATEWGVAPFAPHAFYTHFLDDFNPEHRKMGMEAGRAWLALAGEAWVFTGRGVSEGMLGDIDFAIAHKIPVIRDPPIWSGVFSNG